MLKKIVIVAAIAFTAYYVLHNPQVAGHTVHVAAKNAWHGLKGVAASLAKFINTLSRDRPAVRSMLPPPGSRLRGIDRYLARGERVVFVLRRPAVRLGRAI